MLTLPQGHPGGSKPMGGERGPAPVPGSGACDQDSRWKQYLEDERIALFLQNEEFMKELQRNRDFLLALERGGHHASPQKKRTIWAVASGLRRGLCWRPTCQMLSDLHEHSPPESYRSPGIQPVGVWEHLGTQRKRDVPTRSSPLSYISLGLDDRKECCLSHQPLATRQRYHVLNPGNKVAGSRVGGFLNGRG